MSWLFEDPTLLLVTGCLIEALLAVVLVNTKQLKVVLAMAGVLALVLAGLAVEQWVVTDYERIEAALDATARAVQNNDLERVLDHIDPDATGMRQSVSAFLSRARVSDAHLKDLKIRFIKLASPPAAEAEFIGHVKGNYRSGADGAEGVVIRRIRVDFRRIGERWLMTGYQDLGPPVGPGRIGDREE